MTDAIVPSPRRQPPVPPDPADPPDPVVPALLAGRMLLQAGTSRIGYIRDQIDPVRSGLVISGPSAAASLARHRAKGFTGPALFDPAVYTQTAASEDEPFPSLADGQLSFTDPLADLVEE